MPVAAKKLWSSLRRVFRWCRIVLLVAVLGLAGFLFYWNQAGLPDFLKQAILTELRNRGLALSFQKIRFRWERGIVAEKVTLSRAQLVSGPELALEELQIVISPEQMLRGRLRVNELVLAGGKLRWNFAGTNRPADTLEVGNLQSTLVFHAQDLWELRSLTADFRGARLAATAFVTNIAKARQVWETSKRTATPKTETDDAALRRLVNLLTNWHFAAPSAASLAVNMDALKWQEASAELQIHSADAATPYGGFKEMRLRAQMPSGFLGSNASPWSFALNCQKAELPWAQAESLAARGVVGEIGDGWPNIHLAATAGCRRASTRWGGAEDLKLRILMNPPVNQMSVIAECRRATNEWAVGNHLKLEVRGMPQAANFSLAGAYLQTRWAAASNFQATGQWMACPTNQELIQVESQLDAQAAAAEKIMSCAASRASVRVLLDATNFAWRYFDLDSAWQRVETAWGQAGEARLQARLSPEPALARPLQGANNLVWDVLAPYSGRWSLRLGDAASPELRFDQMEAAGVWRWPSLRLEKLEANLYGGTLSLSGHLDVHARLAQAKVTSFFDVHRLRPVLSPPARRWLDQFALDQPPQIEGEITARLPEWRTPATNWPPLLVEHLVLDGSLAACPGAYRGVRVSEARTHLHYSNRVWRLPDLYLRGPAGQAWLAHEADEKVSSFRWKGRGLADPSAVRPLVEAGAGKVLDLFEFSAPPLIEAEIAGNWRQPRELQVQGRVQATNFTFRGEAIERLETAVEYRTNVAVFAHPSVAARGGTGTADLVVADFNRQFVFLTNGQGSLDPRLVAGCIGPHTLKIIEPYRFGQPPKARVEGVIPMRGEEGADLRFDLQGGPFHWWRFNMQSVTGQVHWIGPAVRLTNISAEFYGGRLQGAAFFDFSQQTDKGTLFNFQAETSGARFQDLMRDISDHTNTVEGLLSGQLVVTRANTDDWKSWEGYGFVNLRDGLIWNIPVFGLFSPVLNALSPGLGNSRARHGAATYTITNSVIRSDDLEIQAGAYSLKYDGTVDFDTRVNARVEAEVLRQTYLVGPVFNLLFKPLTKLFEYKVTGTLAEPKSKPVYVPGFMMKILRPVHSLKGAFEREPKPEEKEKPAPKPPNAPADAGEQPAP